LLADKFRVDDRAVPRYVDDIGPADREQAIQRGGPGGHVRIGIERGRAGFLDKITGEDDHSLAGHHHDQV
jgi:hypothetical protein